MNPKLESLLSKVREIQAARTKNHIGERPICQLTEDVHQARLRTLRGRIAKLSTTGRVAGPEETPTGIRPDSYRGESRVPVGTTLCQ